MTDSLFPRSLDDLSDDSLPAGVVSPQASGAEQLTILESIGIKLIPELEFREISEIIANHFGIRVTKNKLTLVTSRIHPIMVAHGFTSYRQYLDTLACDKSGVMLSELANHISTNHTAFFREDAHFKLLLSSILPALSERKNKEGDHDLRIWCAACSTGEEAYSLQMCLMRHFGDEYRKWKAGVLATDISASALEKAAAGVYSEQKAETVPFDMRMLYFSEKGKEMVEVVPEVRKEVTFRRLNLVNKNYPLKKPFDIIFCRNVMIYFDQVTRDDLIRRLHDWLTPGGYFFIGHSETVMGLDSLFDYVSPSVYTRRKG